MSRTVRTNNGKYIVTVDNAPVAPLPNQVMSTPPEVKAETEPKKKRTVKQKAADDSEPKKKRVSKKNTAEAKEGAGPSPSQGSKVFISIDCEALCVSGGIFAVGASVHSVEDGSVQDEFFASCLPETLPDWKAEHPNRAFMQEHVYPALDPKVNPRPDKLKWHPTHPGPVSMRDAFWKWLLEWRVSGRLEYLVSDWGSIENQFLMQVLADDYQGRWPQFQCPTPLSPIHELGTVLLMRCGDAGKSFPRTKEELPVHHPTTDARQSGRVWFEQLRFGSVPLPTSSKA
jgi:hypothetical protein